MLSQHCASSHLSKGPGIRIELRQIFSLNGCNTCPQSTGEGVRTAGLPRKPGRHDASAAGHPGRCHTTHRTTTILNVSEPCWPCICGLMVFVVMPHSKARGMGLHPVREGGVGRAGTRCEEQLSTYRTLNRRMQEETRATFEEFEASVDRDSARHMVSHSTSAVPNPSPFPRGLHPVAHVLLTLRL